MHLLNSQLRTPSSENCDERCTKIEVSLNGNRRSLEALYLDINEVAKKHGLKVEFRLSKKKPDEPSQG